MSPLLFNLYVNDLSAQLQKLPVGCCCGDMVVNHLMYADDIVLLAPSGKGMQTIIDTTYAYGNAYDIIFNLTKSQVMFYDTLKIGEAANNMLGDTVLNVVQTYRYLGHIITNNLSDEADMEDKMRGFMPGVICFAGSFIFVLTSLIISYFSLTVIYIISEETSVFAPQRIPLYKALGVAACTVGKVRSSTVFMCVCSTIVLLFV